MRKIKGFTKSSLVLLLVLLLTVGSISVASLAEGEKKATVATAEDLAAFDPATS